MVYSQDQIGETLSTQFDNLPVTREGRQFYLSFSHYVSLMRIKNSDERHFYEIEAARNGWSLKEMRRQFDSSLYERLALSRDKDGIMRLATEGQIIEKPEDNSQIFASRYQTILPSKEELKKIIEDAE